jgi:hypothetical protein
MKKSTAAIHSLRATVAAAAIALSLSPAANAQQIDPPKTLRHVYGTVGMPRGFSARLTVANLDAVVPDAPDCQANLQLVGVSPSEAGVESRALLKPGENAVLEIDADKLIPARAPFNARIELAAIVTVSAGGVVDPNECPGSLQIVNNATGITTNAVVQIGTFELPAVQ